MNLLLLPNTENLGFDIESRHWEKVIQCWNTPLTNAKFKSLNFRKLINLVVLLFIQKQFSITIKYVSTFNWMRNACWKYANFCLFCKTCICLKKLENIQISVNMINRLDITDEYWVKCDFILNTVTFIDAALNISLRKLWKCNVLWFYLFGQGVPNETKGTINLKCLWGQLANLDQIICAAILGVGKGRIMFWGRLDQNSGVHGNRNRPLTYNRENGVSIFYRFFWSDPFHTCR